MYKILEGETAADLEKQVRLAMIDGFTPIGGVAVKPTDSIEKPWVFFQAVATLNETPKVK